MKIAIFGLGYVGMTAAACLAHDGHQIVGVDNNEEKVATVNAGKSPITEPGVDMFVAEAVSDGKLFATKDGAPHINDCRLAFVCVGTPSAPDGTHNMTYVAEVTRQIAAMIDPSRPEPVTIAYRSTMRPGSMDELIRPIFELALNGRMSRVELVYNPEFLRESVAINDFYNPPKVVIGTRGRARSEPLDLLNEKISAPVFYTEYKEAELTKFVDNTYHAVKVAFANEIGRICSRSGICAQTTYEIFVSDTKLNISPYYFRPGGAFGGSCLPKDVRALQQIAADLGANALLVDSLIRSNEAHKHFLFERCIRRLEAGARVLMLGLAFKTDSDDLRESPNIDLARKLLQAGFDLSIYDPHIEPAKLVGQNLGYAFSNLPTWCKLLVSKAAAEAGAYDLVIDTKGWARKMTLASTRVLDLSQMK